MGFFPQVSLLEPCAHLSPPPCVPHAPPISFFSILPPAQYWVRGFLTLFLKISGKCKARLFLCGFIFDLCTCLARVHRFEVWQCDDLGIVATVNHLVMGSRWPSYAMPTLGRQARQARTHDAVQDVVSDYTTWNSPH